MGCFIWRVSIMKPTTAKWIGWSGASAGGWGSSNGMTLLYILAVSALGVGLVVFSYIDRIYRELGRVTTGHVDTHLEIFEAEIEPHFHLERARATTGFRLLAHLLLVVVTGDARRSVLLV